ncbi:hypothetical protein BGZ65_004592, partial [Modicella reniformis]
MKIVVKRYNDPGTYNAPTAREVAAVLPGDGSDGPENRDIVVQMWNDDDNGNPIFMRNSAYIHGKPIDVSVWVRTDSVSGFHDATRIPIRFYCGFFCKNPRDIATIPSTIFAVDVGPLTSEIKLPESDERLTNTPQLACCLSLLQASRSNDDTLGPTARKWLEIIEKDTDEQERLKTVHKYKDTFKELLKVLYKGIEQSGLLDIHQLEGLNLYKALVRATSKQMTLSRYQDSSDPYLVYQAAYAYQALTCVPDNESLWKAGIKRTGKAIQGFAGLVSAVKGLDLSKFIDELEDIQRGFTVVSEAVKLVKTAYDEVTSLVESGQSFLECLKEGFSFERKCAWYSALRGADALIRDGELAKFRKLICEVPCRRDPAFQWGVCQRLGKIAANPKWDADTRGNAISFLGEIYKNDTVWGQQATVKQWIINILMQLATPIENGLQFHVTIAATLLRELEVSEDAGKQALVQTCREKGPTSHPLIVAVPALPSPSLLDRVQNKPDVEASLHQLRKQRLKEQGRTVYIQPQAKDGLQAPDSSRFPLAEKVVEFLGSNQK